MDEVRVIARSVAREGRENQLRELLRGMLAPTRAESGCRLYEFYESDACLPKNIDGGHRCSIHCRVQSVDRNKITVRRRETRPSDQLQGLAREGWAARRGLL